MKAENFDYSALPQDAFELANNDIHAHVDRNFASQNYWKDALVRFIRNKGAIFGLIMIAIIIFFAIVGPSMTPYTYESQIIEQQNLAPRIPGLEKLGIFDGSEKMILGDLELEKNDYISKGYEDAYYDVLNTAVSEIKNGGGRILGVLLNDFKVEKGRYVGDYRYEYRMSYHE